MKNLILFLLALISCSPGQPIQDHTESQEITYLFEDTQALEKPVVDRYLNSNYDSFEIILKEPRVLTYLTIDDMGRYIAYCKSKARIDTLFPISDWHRQLGNIFDSYVSIIEVDSVFYYANIRPEETPTFTGFYEFLKEGR